MKDKMAHDVPSPKPPARHIILALKQSPVDCTPPEQADGEEPLNSPGSLPPFTQSKSGAKATWTIPQNEAIINSSSAVQTLVWSLVMDAPRNLIKQKQRHSC